MATGRVPVTPVEDVHHRLESGVYPDDSAALTRSCEARVQPIHAGLGAGPHEEVMGREGRLQMRPTGRRPWRCLGAQTQVREDPLDHRLFQDGRDDLHLAAAVRAVLQVEIEHALEQLAPAQPHRAVIRLRTATG